jgi:hypothetical protein
MRAYKNLSGALIYLQNILRVHSAVLWKRLCERTTFSVRPKLLVHVKVSHIYLHNTCAEKMSWHFNQWGHCLSNDTHFPAKFEQQMAAMFFFPQHCSTTVSQRAQAVKITIKNVRWFISIILRSCTNTLAFVFVLARVYYSKNTSPQFPWNPLYLYLKSIKFFKLYSHNKIPETLKITF